MKNNIFWLLLTGCILLLLSCNNALLKDVTESSYQGVIVEIYRDYKNHGISTFSIRTLSGQITEPAVLFPKSWEYAEVGDSVIKEEGKLYITIKKENGECGVFQYQH
jgi:hypothetical protein